MKNQLAAITVTTVGANITTGAASARVALPVSQSGEIPRLIRVVATANARIKIGTSAVAAVAADMLVQPNDSIIMTIPQGITHIAAIQDTATGTVSVTPLENC